MFTINKVISFCEVSVFFLVAVVKLPAIINMCSLRFQSYDKYHDVIGYVIVFPTITRSTAVAHMKTFLNPGTGVQFAINRDELMHFMSTK